MKNSFFMRFCFALIVVPLTSAALAQPEPPDTGELEKRMREAAVAFLDTLDSQQRDQVAFPFKSDVRQDWHYVPKDRVGLNYHDLNETQTRAARRLLRLGLSETGFEKAGLIRDLEGVLREIEGSAHRDPNLYYFALFGVPDESKPWGWRYEGHHLSLNWTSARGKVIGTSPQFLGTNPATVPTGKRKGLRVLHEEEDLARQLVKSLSVEQQEKAILSGTAPPEVLTGAQRKITPLEDSGIAYGDLNETQQTNLMRLVRTYTDIMPRPLAEARHAKLEKAGIEKLKFAWMGVFEPGQGHYYRIQGPTFVLEYDNTQNNANHIHTVWRDFSGDFGLDLLALHYQQAPHDAAPDYPATSKTASVRIVNPLAAVITHGSPRIRSGNHSR